MDNKTKRELGFSMNELNDNTILIEGIVQGKVSKRTRTRYERNFSKVSLHLFDRECIEKLQKIEVGTVSNDKNIEEKFTESVYKVAKFLLK